MLPPTAVARFAAPEAAPPSAVLLAAPQCAVREAPRQCVVREAPPRFAVPRVVLPIAEAPTTVAAELSRVPLLVSPLAPRQLRVPTIARRPIAAIIPIQPATNPDGKKVAFLGCPTI